MKDTSPGSPGQQGPNTAKRRAWHIPPLAPSMAHGRLTHFELTVSGKLQALLERYSGDPDRQVTWREAEDFEYQTGILLGSFRVGPDTYRYIYDTSAMESGLRRQTTFRNPSFTGDRGTTMCFPFKGYGMPIGSRTIYIFPDTWELTGIGDMRLVGDYLEGMDRSFAWARSMIGAFPERWRLFNLAGNGDNITRRLVAHTTGFGDAALGDGDVPTAVRAYSIGGVLGTPHIARNLRRYASSGPEYEAGVRRALGASGFDYANLSRLEQNCPSLPEA